MTDTPSPEEVEAARRLVEQADARTEAERRAQIRARLEPLISLGLGQGSTIMATPEDLIAAIRETRSLEDLDPNFATLSEATARVVATLVDRVRLLIAASQPIE